MARLQPVEDVCTGGVDDELSLRFAGSESSATTGVQSVQFASNRPKSLTIPRDNTISVPLLNLTWRDVSQAGIPLQEPLNSRADETGYVIAGVGVLVILGDVCPRCVGLAVSFVQSAWCYG